MRRIPIIATLAALLGLLAYSLERTIWLFQRFEVAAEPAIVAAVVVELAAVALIVSSGALPPSARPWGNRALVAVLSVQALANLSAGYLRGGRATLALFGGPDDPSAYAVASVLWLVTNLAIPGLTLSLSKLLEHLITGALEALPNRLDASVDGRVDYPPAAIGASAPGALALDWQALPLKQLSAVPRERLTLFAELFEAQAPQAPQAVASDRPLEDPSAALEPSAAPSAPSDAPSAALEPPRYACPHCHAPLEKKQAIGAAKRNGYCPSCKETARAA